MTPALSWRRIAAIHSAIIGAMAVVVSGSDQFPLKVVYNASASVPLGWYAVSEPGELAAGDFVVVRPPITVARLLVERGYLGDGVPLVKQIGAVPGSTVCRRDARISIDDVPAATARDADALGRRLPRWSGCRRLGPGDVFLLNSGAPGSFDGRYFGPSHARDIIGRARPLWTW